ncbi:MAG: hypothetical protein IPH31_19755 [Lewinellaceae bacterium]|nr:hypothetical protein [Lewinellaceae bacterium]
MKLNGLNVGAPSFALRATAGKQKRSSILENCHVKLSALTLPGGSTFATE